MRKLRLFLSLPTLSVNYINDAKPGEVNKLWLRADVGVALVSNIT